MAAATLIETEEHTRFTVDEYLRLDRAGVFGDRRVELVRGRIYEMPTQGVKHVAAISLTNVVLHRSFSDTKRYWICTQGTLTLSTFDAPEPDFFLFDAPVNTPAVELPTPFLIIEVSKTTLRKDRGPKLQTYAESGVPEYWIENLEDDWIEVRRSPIEKGAGWRYDDVRHYRHGESIALLKHPNVIIAVDDMLPRGLVGVASGD